MKEKTTTTMTRGVRNRNPLNIKYAKRNNWLGKVPDQEKKDPVFEEFTSIIYGLRAAIKLISKYCIRENGSTVKSVVARWAPESDHNLTKNYIAYVEQRMKQLMEKEWAVTDSYDPARPVNPRDYDQMRALITAMSEFESRYTPTNAQILAAWNTV